MSEKVIIRACLNVGYVSVRVLDDYETEYTHEEWEEMSDQEREEALEEVCREHLEASAECNSWVKTAEDEEL